MADGVVVLDAWPIIEHYEGLEPAASVWTGDAEILCGDRVWPVRDLRNADAWQRHEQRRLAGALRAGRRPAVASATDEQIADWLTAPLRRAVRRRAGSP